MHWIGRSHKRGAGGRSHTGPIKYYGFLWVVALRCSRPHLAVYPCIGQGRRGSINSPWACAVPMAFAVPTIGVYVGGGGGSVTYPAHEVLQVPVGRGTIMFQTPTPVYPCTDHQFTIPGLHAVGPRCAYWIRRQLARETTKNSEQIYKI